MKNVNPIRLGFISSSGLTYLWTEGFRPVASVQLFGGSGSLLVSFTNTFRGNFPPMIPFALTAGPGGDWDTSTPAPSGSPIISFWLNPKPSVPSVLSVFSTGFLLPFPDGPSPLPSVHPKLLNISNPTLPPPSGRPRYWDSGDLEFFFQVPRVPIPRPSTRRGQCGI